MFLIDILFPETWPLDTSFIFWVPDLGYLLGKLSLYLWRTPYLKPVKLDYPIQCFIYVFLLFFFHCVVDGSVVFVMDYLQLVWWTLFINHSRMRMDFSTCIIAPRKPLAQYITCCKLLNSAHYCIVYSTSIVKYFLYIRNMVNIRCMLCGFTNYIIFLFTFPMQWIGVKHWTIWELGYLGFENSSVGSCYFISTHMEVLATMRLVHSIPHSPLPLPF